MISLIKNKKIFLQFIIFILYAIFTFIMILHHEVWGDEAQAWVVVRDSSFLEMLGHVRTEGHPLLWYFLILPFAKLVHSFNAVFLMQFLNWFFVLLAAGFLIFKSPFNIFCKSCILLSSGFLYWYPVIARSYCIIPILIFLAAYFFNKQDKQPYIYSLIIILLANTHVIMFGFCFALSCIFALHAKTKKQKIAFALVVLSLLCVAGYLYGSQNENFIVKHSQHLSGIIGFLKVYSRVVFNIYGISNLLVLLMFGLFLIFCSVVFYNKDKRVFFVYLANLIYQFGVYMFVWGSLPQRVYIILFSIVFGFWVIYEKTVNSKLNFYLSLMIALSFLLTFGDGLKMLKDDYVKDFSGGKKTAEFILKNVPQNSVILSNDPVTSTSVSAYLFENKDKYKFWYNGYNDFYTYTLWNKPILPAYASINVSELLKKYDTVYLLISSDVYLSELTPLFVSDINVLTKQERFKIYKITKE